MIRCLSWVAPAALLLVLIGCGSTEPATDVVDEERPEEEAIGVFERDLTPLPVHDATGTPYAQPFLGGFKNPRPQFVDITGNGHPDLFVQETNNQLMFFENEAGADDARQLTWRTDRFLDLEVGEWFRFVDPEDDGQYDLLTESPYNFIRYYRNVGTHHEPAFEVAADTLRDDTGEPIFSDRQNIPNITDLDCNGVPDLLIGRMDGTITRYSATRSAESEIPVFQHITDRFENIEIVEEFGPTLQHGANSLTFADLNEDGAIDLFWGDFFESSLLYFENQGTCERPDLDVEPVPFPPPEPVASSGYNAPALVDWTGNGTLDLFIGVLGGAHDPNATLADNFYYYEAQGDGTYTLQTERFLDGIDVGSETSAAFGDLTGNEAPDLLIANRIAPDNRQTSHVYWFENTGSADEPVLEKRTPLGLPENYHYAPDLGDLTGNGLPDLVVGTWSGDLAVHAHTDADDEIFDPEPLLELELPRSGNANPTLFDVTGNGLLDMVVGASNGELYLFENVGTETDPQFEVREDAFEDMKRPRRSAPAFADLTGNGLPDLVIGSEEDGLVMHRNVGSEGDPVFDEDEESLPVIVPMHATPTFVDLFDTGTPSLVVGADGGGLQYYHIRDTL